MTEKYIEIEHPGVMLKEDFLEDMAIKPGPLALIAPRSKKSLKGNAP